MSRALFVVGISGPDGAGKSTLVGALEERFSEAGFRTARTYAYGCVLCRRVPARRRVRDAPPSRDVVASGERGSRSREWIRSVGAVVRLVHGLIDAGELALRVHLARPGARASATVAPEKRLPTAILLTDRSPLDGLAKFGPSRGSLLDRVYGRLGRMYDAVLLLEAPVAALVERDRDHAASTLAAMTERFARFESRMENIVRLDVENRSPMQAADLAEALIRSRMRDRS